MDTNITYQHVKPDAFGGSVWRKWLVTGETRIPNTLDRADITVSYGRRTIVAETAADHERGHVSVARDVADAFAPDRAEAWDCLTRSYDRFQNEVEAWIRGQQESGIPASFRAGSFMLDCLNSYRRSLDISDPDWHNARLALIGSLEMTSARARVQLLKYVPIEPDPDEEPPGMCFVLIGFDPDGDPEEGDGDEEPDEERDGDGNPDGDNPGDYPIPRDPDGDYRHDPVPAPKLTGRTDRRWLDADIIAELERGILPAEVASHNGLDVTRMPPLARAVAARAAQ